MITTDATLQPWEIQKLGRQAKEFLAGKGRKILILSKGLEWKTMSVNPKDIDFGEGRKYNREGILAALGVPPVMVGLLDNAKYANYILQLINFHKHTILPKIIKMEGCLQTQYLKLWPDLDPTDEFEYIIQYDKSTLMLDDMDVVTKRVAIWFENGWIKRSTAAKLVGLPWDDEDDFDGFFMKNSLVPLDEMFAPGATLQNTNTAIQRQLRVAKKELEKIKEETDART